jgi:hypothetical protein
VPRSRGTTSIEETMSFAAATVAIPGYLAGIWKADPVHSEVARAGGAAAVRRPDAPVRAVRAAARGGVRSHSVGGHVSRVQGVLVGLYVVYAAVIWALEGRPPSLGQAGELDEAREHPAQSESGGGPARMPGSPWPGPPRWQWAACSCGGRAEAAHVTLWKLRAQ